MAMQCPKCKSSTFYKCPKCGEVFCDACSSKQFNARKCPKCGNATGNSHFRG